jgi:hypothetical protein
LIEFQLDVEKRPLASDVASVFGLGPPQFFKSYRVVRPHWGIILRTHHQEVMAFGVSDFAILFTGDNLGGGLRAEAPIRAVNLAADLVAFEIVKPKDHVDPPLHDDYVHILLGLKRDAIALHTSRGELPRHGQTRLK